MIPRVEKKMILPCQTLTVSKKLDAHKLCFGLSECSCHLSISEFSLYFGFIVQLVFSTKQAHARLTLICTQRVDTGIKNRCNRSTATATAAATDKFIDTG